MTRYIGIFSGKGGVGKTSTSISLGAALSNFGKDVIVVDTNLTTPNVGIHLGFPVAPVHLHHVLQGKSKIKDAIYVHPRGTKIVPASIAIEDLENIRPERLPKAIKELGKLSPDFVIVDGAAGLGQEALNAMDAVDEIIIITNPELPSITDALRTIAIAKKKKKDVLGVVVSRAKSRSLDVPLPNVETLLDHPVIGVVPEDRAMREALVLKDSVIFTHPRSRSAVAYKRLAANLIGIEYNERPEVKNRDIFSVMRQFFLDIGLMKKK
ncbi:MAG: cell division ATPase MinD [Candidatus Woesearchaeota archaeon]